MAVGDVVNGIATVTGNFQPAAGVEVLITSIGQTGAGDGYYLYNGAITAVILAASSTTPPRLRLGINNTIYLRYVIAANNVHYSGIQTK